MLLIEAMLCTSMADGDDNWEERSLIEGFMNSLSELKEQVLGAMQETLGIQDDVANNFAEVLMVKYST